MNKKSLSFVIGALFLVFPVLLPAQARTQGEPRGTVGFISHTEGEVFFQNNERAEPDMVVTQGDELMTQKGRAEVDLGRGNWLRLDEHTRVSLTSLQKNSVKLSVEQGSIYLHLESKTAEVRTPTETFRPESGLCRVDVEKNKAKIYDNPRVVDRFDSWNSRLEERLNRPEYESNYGDYGNYGYGYGNWYGGWRNPYGWGGAHIPIGGPHTRLGTGPHGPILAILPGFPSILRTFMAMGDYGIQIWEVNSPPGPASETLLRPVFLSIEVYQRFIFPGHFKIILFAAVFQILPSALRVGRLASPPVRTSSRGC